MATPIFNASCSFTSIKGTYFKSYFGLNSTKSKTQIGSLPISNLSRHRSLVVRASESSNGQAKKLGRSDAECEADVAAGIVPESPPVPPKPVSPAGTPVIKPLNLSRRPRRNRASPVARAAFQETNLSPANFVYPLFIHEGEEDTPIGAMPGCYRLGWRHGLVQEVAKARAVGVNSIVLFPKVPEALKNPTGDESYNDNVYFLSRFRESIR